MDKKDMRELITSKEFQRMEWKASLAEKRQIGETVSAFANTNDGVILVGVSPEGDIVGVNIVKGTLEQLANFIKQCTDPEVYPNIEEHRIDDREIIEISVKEARKKPIFFKGRAYQRVGRSNHIMSSDQIAELMSQSRLILHWDERICAEATLEDIDPEKVRWFLQKARSERRSDVDLNMSSKAALERLALIRNEQLTNAAILLFGKNPQKFFRQAETRCARFKGLAPIEFIDMKVLKGCIIEQREDAVEFIKEHIKLHAKIVGAERVETWQYPIEAIREAVTNAICHRDYEMFANVQVRIFDDRIEFLGCGPLPQPLTVEDLKRMHVSILRNPLIGGCFFRINFIDQWGTGTIRMINACRRHGLPEPLFEERSEGLVVTLREVTDTMLEELSDREQAIIEYLRRHGRISRSECAELLGSAPATAHRYLKLLETKGIISRRGAGRSTYYELSLDV